MKRTLGQKNYVLLESLVGQGGDPMSLWELYKCVGSPQTKDTPAALEDFERNQNQTFYSMPESEVNSDVFQSILRGQLFYFSQVLEILDLVMRTQDLQFIILRYNIEPLPFLDSSQETRIMVLQLLGENPESFQTISKSIENYRMAYSVFARRKASDKRWQRTYSGSPRLL